MLRFPPAGVLLLVLASYSTLWTAMRGEADYQDNAESGTSNSSQCTPCDLGREPDYSSGDCNCSSCNCSLLGPSHSSSLPFSQYFRQSCNCSGFCENANSSCTQCEEGTYADKKGLPKCKLCLEGSYSDSLGAHECLKCPKGHYQSSQGSTQCDECPQGSYTNKLGSPYCSNCSEGTFSNDTGLSACWNCSDGYFSNSEGATSCSVCGNGTYTNSSTGFKKCKTCDSGHICNKTGCDSCTPCSPGYSSMDPDECHLCQLGTFAPGHGNSRCTDCEQGTVCMKAGCSECLACPLGQQPANKISLFSCEQCLPGMFRGDSSGYYCEDCEKGYYQVDSGKSECSICPKNYYCPYSTAEPQSCPDDAQCPRGSVQPLFCKNFFTYSDTKEKCVPKAIFYITVTLVILFAVLVITLIACTVYWNVLRKKTMPYEKLPLKSHSKMPVSEPVYSGH